MSPVLSALLVKTLFAGLTVTVPAEAQVRGRSIELGELCQVVGADAGLVERARGVDLGYSPTPAFSRTLTREHLRAVLADALPDHLVRFVGERTCRVRTEVEEIATDRLESAGRAALERALGGAAATVTLATALEPVSVPRGDAALRIEARVAAGAGLDGVAGVSLEIWTDGLLYRTVWTSWRVDVWETSPAPVPQPSALPLLLGMRDERLDDPVRDAFVW